MEDEKKKFQKAVAPVAAPENRYGKKTLAQLMVEEMKTEEAYNKSVVREKECYDRYLKAMSERAVRMEHWLSAQRDAEICKKRMGIKSE